MWAYETERCLSNEPDACTYVHTTHPKILSVFRLRAHAPRRRFDEKKPVSLFGFLISSGDLEQLRTHITRIDGESVRPREPTIGYDRVNILRFFLPKTFISTRHLVFFSSRGSYTNNRIECFSRVVPNAKSPARGAHMRSNKLQNKNQITKQKLYKTCPRRFLCFILQDLKFYKHHQHNHRRD